MEHRSNRMRTLTEMLQHKFKMQLIQVEPQAISCGTGIGAAQPPKFNGLTSCLSSDSSSRPWQTTECPARKRNSWLLPCMNQQPTKHPHWGRGYWGAWELLSDYHLEAAFHLELMSRTHLIRESLWEFATASDHWLTKPSWTTQHSISKEAAHALTKGVWGWDIRQLLYGTRK